MFTVSCLLLACAKGTPSDPVTAPAADREADVEAARAFQLEYERALRANEYSFLTVVESHYVGLTHTLQLESEGHIITFEMHPERVNVSMDGTIPLDPIEDYGQVDPEGRYSFSVSRQEADWRVLVHDRDAPSRESFSGIEWFPIDPASIVDAHYELDAERAPTVMQTSRGVTKTLYVAGKAKFELAGRPLELTAFAYSAEPVPDEPLLIPFRDETTGHESYTAGRYLEPTTPPGERLRLDFNRATNPLCAYSEHYNCPMPPRYNTLAIEIRAGAKAPAAH